MEVMTISKKVIAMFYEFLSVGCSQTQSIVITGCLPKILLV